MLEDANLVGTFYIITDEAKNADPANINDEDSYMDYGRIHEIAAAGNEVTAHTRTHASLLNLSTAQLLSEVQGSRQDLLDEGFTPVNTFAYTYGEYDARSIQAVKDAGFAGARTVDDGYNTKLTDKFLLMDQNVETTTSAAQMIEWINTAVANKTWVILTFHQVYSGTDQYSTTPAKLQQVVDYLEENDIPVITTSQGLQLMQ